MIPGLTIVRKPLETYLIVREGDGDRELTAAECQQLYDADSERARLATMLQEAHDKWEHCIEVNKQLRSRLMPDPDGPAADQERDHLAGQCADLLRENEPLRAALTEAVSLFECYGLVAAQIPGDPMRAGRWINQAREALSHEQSQEPTP